MFYMHRGEITKRSNVQQSNLEAKEIPKQFKQKTDFFYQKELQCCVCVPFLNSWIREA